MEDLNKLMLDEMKQFSYFELKEQRLKITSFQCSRFNDLVSCLNVLSKLDYCIEFNNILFIEDEINLLYNLNILKDIYFSNCQFLEIGFKNLSLLYNTTNKFIKPFFTVDHNLKSNLEILEYRKNNISKLEKVSFKLYESEDDLITMQVYFKDLMNLKDYNNLSSKIKLRIDKNIMTLDSWYNFFKFEKKYLESYNHFYDRNSLGFQEIKLNFLKLYYALN